MRTISLMGVASYLPERVVHNEFFGAAAAKRGMFTVPTARRHVASRETAADMIERAGNKLLQQQGIGEPDVDILLTNVSVPDEVFTGCGAEVAHRLGLRPKYILDVHNSGCVSFVYMMELARALLQTPDTRGALLCCVQNAGGRIFSQSEVRQKPQAPIPGDGCGVGFVAASEASPILAAIHRSFGENAKDMSATGDDGRRYWEPGLSQLSVNFTEARVASIINRGNRVVPEVVAAACDQAGVRPQDLELLLTNQPNPIFLRNWREALQLRQGAAPWTRSTVMGTSLARRFRSTLKMP